LISFVMTFYQLSCVRQESCKETDLRDRLCGAGPLRIPLERRAFAHKEAQMLPPIEIFHNAAPTDASVPAGRLFVLYLFRELTARTLTFQKG